MNTEINLKRSVILLLILSFALNLALAYQLFREKPEPIKSTGTVSSSLISARTINPDEVMVLLNKYRTEKKIEALAISENLCTLAEKRIDEMKGKRFSHEGLFKFFNQNNLGENLAEGYFTSEQVVEAWKESKSHNELLINEKMKYACVRVDETHVVLLVSDKD